MLLVVTDDNDRNSRYFDEVVMLEKSWKDRVRYAQSVNGNSVRQSQQLTVVSRSAEALKVRYERQSDVLPENKN